MGDNALHHSTQPHIVTVEIFIPFHKNLYIYIIHIVYILTRYQHQPHRLVIDQSFCLFQEQEKKTNKQNKPPEKTILAPK